MSFFKDFKSDISQAVNELMPDGNEMYDADELIEERSEGMSEKDASKKEDAGNNKEKRTKTRKNIRTKKRNKQDKEQSNTLFGNTDNTLGKMTAKNSKAVNSDSEIAPEDMLDQIDDLLEKELYSDDTDKQMLLQDDMEVNTMDMSVEDLLNQLSVKQEKEMNSSAKSAEQTLTSDEEKKEDITESVGKDMGLEALLDSISGKNTSSEAGQVQSAMHDAEIKSNAITEDAVQNIEEADDANLISSDVVNVSGEEDSETMQETMSETEFDVFDKTHTEQKSDRSEELMMEEMEVKNMIYDKDTSVEDSMDTESQTTEEQKSRMNETEIDTTYITKGTSIKGDIEVEGSIDILGDVEGNVNCKGKVMVGGKVNGAISAGELYANSARIEGDIKSYGSVKIGVGSMIVGKIEAESSVIAGAVNGDINVHGPVIIDSTAVIMGNITSRSVQINNGAVIEGFCSQSYSDIDVKSFFS